MDRRKVKKRMTHIALLAEAIGAGHERAAMAVEEALLRRYPGVRVTRMNLLDTFRPTTAKVIRALYLQTLEHYPNWWGKWYEAKREKEWKGLSRSIVRDVLKRDVARWLRQFSPDAVVCTHPLPAVLLAEMKKRGFPLLLCSVLTDFDFHGYWTHPLVDLYCVPLEEIARSFRQWPGHYGSVHVTGIPVSQAFSREALRQRQRTGHTARVLLIGGSLGIGVWTVVHRLLQAGIPCEWTVVCGNNKQLFKELTALYGRRKDVQILGFSKKIQEIMGGSDLLVTKPGGLTIAEALTMRLPMVLYTPIQGQEKRNGQVMYNLGVAVTAETEEEVVRYVSRLVTDEGWRRRMAEQAEKVRRPHAADDIADLVMSAVNKRSGTSLPTMLS